MIKLVIKEYRTRGNQRKALLIDLLLGKPQSSIRQPPSVRGLIHSWPTVSDCALHGLSGTRAEGHLYSALSGVKGFFMCKPFYEALRTFSKDGKHPQAPLPFLSNRMTGFFVASMCLHGYHHSQVPLCPLLKLKPYSRIRD